MRANLRQLSELELLRASFEFVVALQTQASFGDESFANSSTQIAKAKKATQIL